jgi:predicted DNA-binding transcriptional regulator YafY
MQEKDFAGDKKYYRVLKILNLLNEKGSVKIADLAAEFDVTERSIQRDIERVNMTFGLEQSGKGEYSFAAGVSLKEMRLSGEQLSALIFMNEIFKGMGGAFSKSFEALFQRMAKSSPWESPYSIIMPRPSKELDITKLIPDAETAILEHRKIRVDYPTKGVHASRVLSPLKLLVDNGFYYILAMGAKKGEYVKYRLDKMKNIELTPDTFTPPANIASQRPEDSDAPEDRPVSRRFLPQKRVLSPPKSNKGVPRRFHTAGIPAGTAHGSNSDHPQLDPGHRGSGAGKAQDRYPHPRRAIPEEDTTPGRLRNRKIAKRRRISLFHYFAVSLLRDLTVPFTERPGKPRACRRFPARYPAGPARLWVPPYPA